MFIKTRPRIAKELKDKIIAYIKEGHSVNNACEVFNMAYNTVNFWVNPKYQAYQRVQSKKKHDEVLENSKKYSMQRRKKDPEYVARRNEQAKAWQKAKRKKDTEWRDARRKEASQYFKKHQHEEWYLALGRKAARKRRALKLMVNENYTKEDENYTKKLFKNKCAVCGSNEKLTIDHWLPLSGGNALTRKNAVLMCFKCNLIKSDKLPTQCYEQSLVVKINNLLNKA